MFIVLIVKRFFAPFQTDAVPAPDVHLKILQNRLRDAASKTEKQEIIREIEDLYEVRCESSYANTNRDKPHCNWVSQKNSQNYWIYKKMYEYINKKSQFKATEIKGLENQKVEKIEVWLSKLY